MLLNSDGYHFTMGYLFGAKAMQMETHVVYARTGGPIVIPNLSEIAKQFSNWRPSMDDINEAGIYWTSQGVPFHREAWEKISSMKKIPFSIRGVRDGEVVLPGEPIAVIEAPAVMAAVPEPVIISALMKSAQVATRFTKVSQALGWDRSRIFEVGKRAANSDSDHNESIKILQSVGLQMTSSGIAGKQAGIASGGSMGHRYTQRFDNDYDAFMNAANRMIEFRQSRNINKKVSVSFLLDTRSTLQSGLPAAIQVFKERFDDIRDNLNVSVRLDSGDLDYQLKIIIKRFQAEFEKMDFMPSIIVESGLTGEDIFRFERIARAMKFPLKNMFYGFGGYLVGGISRDFVSMVYKVSSYDGQSTMKFADEKGGAKESYPGRVTLMERGRDIVTQRCLAQQSEVAQMTSDGWKEIFIDIVKDGQFVAPEISKEERVQRIESRWATIGKGYIGNEKRPKDFAVKPKLSAGTKREIALIKAQYFNSSNLVA